MITCKICKIKIDNIQKLSKHLIKHDNISVLQYFINYENFKIPKCKHCDNEAKLLKGIIFRNTCGSKDCKKKEFSLRKHSDDSKSKISRSMKLSHSNGNHPGWSFINKDINKRSYPEKWFIKNILEKYDLYNKYTIKEKMPFHKYFLDFAFLELKIDIEIDGQQHFRNNESIEHDKERDNFLLDKNWKIYRMAWLEMKNKPNEIIKDFLNWLDRESLYRKYDLNEIQLLLKKKELKFGNRKKYFENVIKKSYDKYKPIMEIIKNSDIDFSKYGWVKEVSTLTGIKEQKVGKLMKKYLPDFYNKCFKRKNGPIV